MNKQQLNDVVRNIEEWNGEYTYLELYNELERLYNNWEYKQTTDSFDSAMLEDCELNSRESVKSVLNGLHDHVKDCVLGYFNKTDYELQSEDSLRDLTIRTVLNAYDRELNEYGYIKMYSRKVKEQTKK